MQGMFLLQPRIAVFSAAVALLTVQIAIASFRAENWGLFELPIPLELAKFIYTIFLILFAMLTYFSEPILTKVNNLFQRLADLAIIIKGTGKEPLIGLIERLNNVVAFGIKYLGIGSLFVLGVVIAVTPTIFFKGPSVWEGIVAVFLAITPLAIWFWQGIGPVERNP